jgi:site-specific recombinase XerD
MGLTIGLTQLKRKKRKDGSIPIYIRITEDRKSRYRSTGIAVKKSEWNSNKKVVSVKSDTKTLQLNIELKKQLNIIEEIKRDLYKRDSLSMAAILNELAEDTDTRSILHQAHQYRHHLGNDDRYWEHRHFGVVINNLSAFIDTNGHSDRLDKLDSDWITGLQTHLLKDVGNGNNTVRKKMQRFKSMVTWLIKNNELRSDPFTKVERVERKKSNNKVKLTFKQIEAIKNLQLEQGSDLWHVRNYFMYSFYNAGIRFGDLCCLKWDNLIDGRLIYTMNKTGGRKSIQQLEPMQQILDLYRTDDCTGYIFPILQKDFSDPGELRKRISSNNVIVNRHLKTIAKKAGIQSHISFHVSRHSFANYALKKGMDLYAISKALGHSDLKITEEYIKSFDEELLDNSMNKLF